MDLAFVTSVLIDIMILPLQLVLVPIDYLLANIPGIAAIPSAISGVLSLIGAIPSTLVYLFGINPLIWNSLIMTFLAYITFSPTIQFAKKIWAWVRP